MGNGTQTGSWTANPWFNASPTCFIGTPLTSFAWWIPIAHPITRAPKKLMIQPWQSQLWEYMDIGVKCPTSIITTIVTRQNDQLSAVERTRSNVSGVLGCIITPSLLQTNFSRTIGLICFGNYDFVITLKSNNCVRKMGVSKSSLLHSNHKCIPVSKFSCRLTV